MTLPVSPNSISADQIRKEFGPLSGAVSLGAYRLDTQQLNTNAGTEAYKTALGIAKIPLDDDIPTSGEIKFSHFRGKRLNLIVDFYNHATTSTNTAQLTQDVIFTVYRQGSNLRDAFVTFTAQDGSVHSFTISNDIGSDTEAQEVRNVRKNVTYNVVFTEPNKTTQNGLIASSDGLKSTASDTGSHSMRGNIQKLVAGTSKKAFGDRVGSNNDRNDMQITLSEGVNHIFTSGTGVRINTSGASVAGDIDGFGGGENQRTTRPLTYRLEEIISTTSGIFRKNIRTRYEDNSPNTTIVVGGFKSKPDAPAAGSKVIAFVNQTIGSAKGDRNYCALRTGTWGTDVNLEIVVGAAGIINGAGGDGGNGGSFGANPNRYNPNNNQSQIAFGIGNISAGNGGDGSSALGIEYPTKIINQGVIRKGRGGGGGGGSGSGVEYHDISDCSNKRTSPLVGGGGGAGGSGLPVGNGGQFGDYLSRLSNKNRGSTTMPTSGTSASATDDGQGGSGGSVVPADYPKCSTKIAVSGAGGAAESDGGNGNNAYTSRGLGGKKGYAIIITSTGSLVGGSISGNASDGDTLNPGTIT
jgi:hypothetical protein